MSFKIHLLPHNDAKTHDKTIPHFEKAYYTGPSKVLSGFLNNIIYIAAFLLPVIFMSVLFAIHGFMPFGDKDIFILNNTQKAVPGLLDFISQIQNGRFSLFLSNGLISTDAVYTLIFYLASPLHLILLLFPAKAALSLLHIITVFKIGFSGFATAYYLTHREKGNRYSKYDPAVLIFSLCYSLSSYMLVQYNDIMYMDCAVLFPLLFLAFEGLIYQGKKRNFFLIFSYMLLCNFYLATIVFISLLIYYLVQPKNDLRTSCMNLCRFLITSVLSFATSAITVIPGLYMFYHQNIKDAITPDFSFLTDWISYYSLFLPANQGSYSWTDIFGNNLYCGLLFVFLLVFFIVNKKIKFREKLSNILYLFLLIFISNTSSFQYYAHLCGYDNSFFNAFGFLVPFFMIAFCCDSLFDLENNKGIKNIACILIPFGLYAYASFSSVIYNNSASIAFSLIFFVIYLLLFLFYSIHSIDGKAFFTCLCLLLMFELGYNGIRNAEFIAADSLSYTNKTDKLTVGITENTYTPLNIPGSKFSLPLCYHISGDYNYNTPYSTTEFRRLNEIAHSLGAESDIFTDAKLDISWKASENIICKQTSDNIFTLSVKEDTPNSKVPTNRIFLSITPDQTGDLYIYSNELVHLGEVTSGKTVSYTMSFETTTNLCTNYWIYGVYFHPEVLEELEDKLHCEYTAPEKSGLFGYKFTIRPESDGTFVINTPYSKFTKIYVDGVLSETRKGPSDQTAVSVTAGTHNLFIKYSFTPLYAGIVVSLLMLCLVLPACGYARKKETFVARTRRIYDRIIAADFWSKTSAFFSRNAIAILSFVIPFCVLLLACIFSSYAPFGNDSFYKNDGSALTIPQMYQMQNHLSRNSLLYSWSTGGGSNLFYTLPSMFLYYWLCLINAEHMISALTVIEIIIMALSGFTVYLYLTKRAVGQKMHKQDYRILIFTTAYSLCAYNINFRGFFSWPVIFALFPLLLLSLDVLMYRKKTILYTLCLTLIIMFNYQLAMYICVFLVFTFFTYHFDNIKDFFGKGIRFAVGSLIAGGLNFYALYATILGMRISPYQVSDSVAPDFSFYQSYWTSLKQLFAFSEPVIVTDSDGAVNLYCGLLCLILMFVSLLISRRKRIVWMKLGFIVFLIFSSNNELLSYIWNGFHYQSKVPNRYSFLTILLIIDLACEALYNLKKMTLRHYAATSLAVIALSGCTVFFTRKEISLLSATASIAIIITFLVILLLIYKKPKWNRLLMRCFLVISLIEISANVTHNLVSVPAEISINYSSEAIDYLKKQLTNTNASKRIAILGPNSVNQNMIHNVNIMSQFNSFFTQYQQQRGLLYGYLSSTNFLKADYNLTPFTNTMDAVEYMTLDYFTTSSYIDLEHYKPVAQYKSSIVLHNENALSLAHYAPYEAYVFTQDSQQFSDFANNYASAFIGNREIYKHSEFIYNTDKKEEKNADSENYYTLTINEELGDNKFVQTLHYTPKESGEYYYRSQEFHYLGYLEAGKEYTFDICTTGDFEGMIAMFDYEAYEAFVEEISKHTIQVTSQTDTTLDGTITLPKDGCIVFSVPFEDGWTVYLDGEKTNTTSMNDGSLFITATEGTHEIHMEFRPVGLDTCINVSLVFVLLFLLVLFIETRRKKSVPVNTLASEESVEQDSIQ